MQWVRTTIRGSKKQNKYNQMGSEVANIEQELTSSSFFESAMAARRRPPVDDLN
jgi:hypothetical protein